MKGFAALAVFAAPCAAQFVNDAEYIKRINSMNDDGLWRAAPQRFFEGMTVKEARMLLGAHLSHIDNHLNETAGEGHFKIADGALPKSFDSRKTWEGLIHPIRDQERCGSCWAFSASEVLSDRFAIAKKAPSPVLSAEDMVECDRGDHGCGGGQLSHAWAYLVSTGIVTDTCMPYKAGSGKVPKCTTTCADQEQFERFKAEKSYAIKGPKHMMKDLVQNGPIQVGFMVYRSFMSYHTGIYHKLKSEKSPEGGHAVKVVGYGAEKGKRYWIVANSWNTDWGEQGFFRILRGKDECGIETMGPPYAGMPKVESEIVV